MGETKVTRFFDVSIDAVQRYWNSRPCNIRHSPSPIGSRQYFDEVEARKFFIEPHIPAFADFNRWKGKRVLEIGCGIGTDTISFARAGAHVTAIDLSEKSIELAKQRADVYGLSDRIQFIHMNAEEISADNPMFGSFDLIYSFGVIHHSPNPDVILKNLRSLAGPTTELRIMVYYRYSFKVLWILWKAGLTQLRNLDQLVARYSEAQTGCPVTYTYSRAGARRWLRAAGFRTTHIEVDHIFPYKISDYVQYRYRRVWYFRWMPQTLFRALERAWGWHLMVVARPMSDAEMKGSLK